MALVGSSVSGISAGCGVACVVGWGLLIGDSSGAGVVGDGSTGWGDVVDDMEGAIVNDCFGLDVFFFEGALGGAVAEFASSSTSKLDIVNIWNSTDPKSPPPEARSSIWKPFSSTV